MKTAKSPFSIRFLLAVLTFLFHLALYPIHEAAGEAKPPPSDDKDLLQYKAESHVMGFTSDMVYLANPAGFFSIKFLGAHAIPPVPVPIQPSQPHGITQTLADSTINIPTLHRVEYPSLWNGITLRYDGVQGAIAESTFFIQPRTDVSAIRLQYSTETELQPDGSLKITLPSKQGYITESRPVAWQILDGRKKEVQVAYTIQDGTIGFTTGAYSREHELIIDPTYQWHTFYGSPSYDEGSSIAVDRQGNVYITGHSSGNWLGPNNTAPKHAYQSGTDIVVVKLDNSGTYQWHTFYGSTAYDEGTGITVDKNGNVYVTGTSLNSWLGPNNTAPQNAYKGSYDLVALKIDSSGTYQWHTFHGSAGSDYGNAITVDENGYTYITGESDATWSVPIGSVSFRLPLHSHSGLSDIVAVKLNDSGISLWHTFYGSAGYDTGNSIALDQSGNVFITGESNSFWFGPDCENPKYAYQGGYDIVDLKLLNSGEYHGHSFFGSTMNDWGNGIAVDSHENIYITGHSEATWGSPVHPFTSAPSDIVVFGLDSAGALIWNTFHGFAADDYSFGIALDANGNIYITGYGWDSTWGDVGDDIITCKLSHSGKLIWHTFHGSSANDDGRGITLDVNGNIYVTGYSEATWGHPLDAYINKSDIFVMKFHQFPWPMFLPAITKEGR